MHALWRINACSFVLAFCGLLYELILAQTLSILLGNSVVQYSLTIGLFMAAMGFGSLFAPKEGPREKYLAWSQVALAAVAGAGILVINVLALHLGTVPLWLVSAMLVVTIGAITGLELPLLMDMAGPPGRLSALAFDYFGMLVACTSFPLILLPKFGTLGLTFLAAALNAAVAVFLIWPLWPRRRWLALALPGAMILAFSVEGVIRRWLSLSFIQR